MDVLFLVKMITKMIENSVQLYPQSPKCPIPCKI